ncbi:unnamed protein product [Rotaria sp. Silwood1]|nr:unnamed protein product [Rotaria sp. Silwood1]
MPRVFRLPPLTGEHVDCILVYNHGDNKKNDNEHNENCNKMSRSERRKRFEDYLVKKQGLMLQHVTSTTDQTEYVKVHVPFEILLSTAENIRMKLPIEKIHPEQPEVSTHNTSCWYRFSHWLKKPFRLDPSLINDDIDYYTAIYSSNIDKFEPLFKELRGSRDLYFTPSERSLLTYELLSRAHRDGDGTVDVDDDDDDDDDYPKEPVAIRPVFNTVEGLRSGSRRPGIARLIAKKAYDNCFPLHEPLRDDVANIDDSELNDREKLKKHWATMSQCLKFQPLSLIRSYMGEKMTFYFALSGFYNQMLILPAFVGLIVFIYGAASVASDEPTSDICGSYGNSTYMCPRCDKTCPFWKLIDSCVYSKVSYVFDNVSTVVFAFLMSLWARWFIERWKRREAVLRYDWDSIDFDENLEPIRPEFENEAQKIDEKRINPVTNMLIVCATIFAIIVYRVQMDYILRETSVKQYSSIIITVTSAIMNLICSILLSQFYYWVARKLTDLELHKYQSNYDDSLTIKIYLFQFVNFYSSLFYIAFFKGRFDEYPSKYGESSSKDFTEQCDPAGCFVELAIQFLIIMTGKQIVNNILEFFFAICGTCACVCCNRDIDTKKEQWEIDKNLNNFESTTLIDEYLELVIQFGFVTLFVIAFPLAPLFALINNLIEVRLDAWKFLSKYKRPIPHKASDIGIWGNIMSAVSYLAVLTNAVVIAWTSEFIPKMAYRSLQSTGTSLSGYVNWTLSSFPIADYNLTGTMPSGVPSGLTYCRYRDFRESTGPSYSHTSVYWNVTAARLVFIILFEHIIFIFIYLMQWLVPDVPKSIQDKIAHERYIDQRERWASNKREENIKKTDHNSRETSKTIKNLPFPITYPGNIKSSADVKSPVNDKSPVDDKSPVNVKSPTVKSKRRTIIRARISPKDTY